VQSTELHRSVHFHFSHLLNEHRIPNYQSPRTPLTQLSRTKLIHITTANWSLLQHCIRKLNLLKLLYYYCHFCRTIRLSFECLPEVLVQAFALMLTLTAAESDRVMAFAPLQVIIATKREGERDLDKRNREK